MTRAYERFELDVPRCIRTYGESPCTAAVGVTDKGKGKCKNSPATCQDPANYSSETHVLRWVKNTSDAKLDPPARASLVSINVDSQRLNSGEDLGKRERVTVRISNSRSDDFDLDPYVEDRDYNPFQQGTALGKFAAIYPNIKGYECRVIRRYENDDGTTEETTEHYYADGGSISGDMSGYTITARDALMWVEGNKTLWPLPNNGAIDRDLTTSTTSFTLLPAGIGNQEYPFSGEYVMGEEYGTFIRTGDDVTLTSRGIFGSDIEEHEEGETFQASGVIDSQNAAEIIELLLSKSDLPQKYIDNSRAQWQAEAEAIDQRFYTARFAEPTEIHKALSELMKDLALEIYTDVINERIVMRFIRPLIANRTLTDDLMDSISRSDDNAGQISAAYIRYGRRNPIEKIDEPKNYRGRIYRVTSNASIQLQANAPAIRSHFSRYIPSLLRAAASETAEIMVVRREKPLAKINCVLPRDRSPSIGEVTNVRSRLLEDQNGAFETIQMQAVKVDRGLANNTVELLEYRAQQRQAEGVRLVSLDEDQLNMGPFNSLREIHDSVYGSDPIPEGTEVVFDATPGVVYGSSSTDQFAVRTGGSSEWPELSSDVTIVIRGLYVAGAGGSAPPASATQDGGDGGDAMLAEVPVRIDNCVFAGGGGAGGAFRGGPTGQTVAQGGGGAGRVAGVGNESGTLTAGGAGGTNAGNGGSRGQPGQDSTTSGGAAGRAIVGWSNVTQVGPNSFFGSVVN